MKVQSFIEKTLDVNGGYKWGNISTSRVVLRHVPRLLALLTSMHFGNIAHTQPISEIRQPPSVAISPPSPILDCPHCIPTDIKLYKDIVEKYQGMKGINPTAPSTYDLIGSRKYNGGLSGMISPAWGENWYPIRVEKQILTGLFYRFGVYNFGDESDWNIHILPDPGFEYFVSEAIPYRQSNWHGFSDDWNTTDDGRYTVEAEITPDERRYGNPWFNNNTMNSHLVGKKLSVYGPFVREEAHGNWPEIHPCEQIWWKEGNDVTMVLLVIDDSNRFNDDGDFSKRKVSTSDYKPWALEKGQEAELSIAFEIDPKLERMHIGIQALDALDFYTGLAYSNGGINEYTFNGKTVLTVQKASDIDRFVGVTFQNVCYDNGTGKLQGYVVLNTAIGNGDRKEGFAALRIEKKKIGIKAEPIIFTGSLNNVWTSLAIYDNQVAFSDIISSDISGKGIVHGRIDFNGNGVTDCFAKKGNKWMVLYDGRAKWQELNTSSIPIDQLRFGDINGDKKTDVLYVNDRGKVMVSYGGISLWIELTDAGEQNKMIQVSDFNGDGITDLVYFKTKMGIVNDQAKIMGDMYIKYGGIGTWKRININYHLLNSDDYANNFRFGDFNGDGITDVFRYYDKKFLVYWNGTGDFKVLCDPRFELTTNDLMFVTSLKKHRYTDIIYTYKDSDHWILFDEGRIPSSPFGMKYSKPTVVRFGNFEQNALTIPFAFDFKEDIPKFDMPLLPKVAIEPGVRMRYLPGSIKRIKEDGKNSLTVSAEIRYYPGSGNTKRQRQHFQRVLSIKESPTGKDLQYKPSAISPIETDEIRTIGVIEKINRNKIIENNIQITFDTLSTPENFTLPGYAITGSVGNKLELSGSQGEWQKWKSLLMSNFELDPAKLDLLNSPPSSPVMIKSIAFEIFPLYSSLEAGRISLVEMDDMCVELNYIAYGGERSQLIDIFDNEKVFLIKWQFELTNMSTGKKIPISNPNTLISDGKWDKNKIAYTFPQSSDILQFKATATITDYLGNSTMHPMEFNFWNQRIELDNVGEQITEWLLTIKNKTGVDYTHIEIKSKFLADDGILNPEEIMTLLKNN